MTCKQYDQWKSSSTDSDTLTWLKKNSKKCPKCHSYIEKISGCDHMTCKKCQHEFCWECFSDYKKIQKDGLNNHMNTCSHYRLSNQLYTPVNTQRSSTCNIS
ncbi:unnamed protein product [Adineta steineri]|uniref:RING-type domain-containing protein n=1 Tax=Adineta steineri TaxID=433720 RepID=A0A815NV24_9BILA|nr:unnamed protein product [Adineta steineri]CAF3820036.1 unnamed protein product [Adineta steineri]